MLSFANPTLPEFSDDLLIAPAVEALQGLHGKPNTFSSYTTRRDTAHDCLLPSRYPYLGAEDISSVTRVEDIPAPYVATPVVSGNRAKVEVFPAGNNKISNPPSFDLGRNLYFLNKSENGWRVTNVMIHTKWPDLDDGTHNCYFSLAKPANDEEKKEFPKHCR